MSATVVTTYARTPIADILSVESVTKLSDADLRKRYGLVIADGQLWERVAEREPKHTTRLERVTRHARVERKRGNR